MSKTPLVSIITPSYNQVDYLEQTILSVLEQDYKPIEYIIVDGASTDGSLEIIQRYSDNLAWWVSEPDSGQAEAVNKGWKQATGEIIGWLNSDDLFMPNAITEAVAALQENPKLGLVYGDAITIDAQGKPLNMLSFGEWGLLELMGFRIICQPAVFTRREVLEKAGYLDQTYDLLLDSHLWIQIARLAPIQYVGTDLCASPASEGTCRLGLWAATRHHSTAKNTAMASSYRNDVMRILEWMETQPDLAPLLARNRRRILAGAHRLSARYLLDGNLPEEALKHYWQALIAWPGFALEHWHRITYAVLRLVGVMGIADRLRNHLSTRRRRQLVSKLRKIRLPSSYQGRASRTNGNGLDNWPGLFLDM